MALVVVHAPVDPLESFLMRARFYYRISQDRTGEMLGVERQEPESLALAERLGFDASEPYVDNDLSATSGIERPAFERLLRDLASDPSPVIVWHTDRLIRVMSDLERVIDTGVNVHAVHAGHLDLSTPAGRAVARTLTAWAQYEGEQKSLRQRAKAQQMAEKGQAWWAHRPFGYELDGTLRDDEAAALQDCYTSLLAGASLGSLAKGLNERGFRTNRGKEWNHSNLGQLLKKPRNTGIRTYKGEEVGPGNWVPIVPETTFRAAMRLLSDPARDKTHGWKGGRGRRRHLLSSFATCGKCGELMKVEWKGKNPDKKFKVYICRNGRHVSAPVDFVDERVEALVIARLTRPDAAAILSETEATDVEALREEASALTQRLDALAEDYADGLLTREAMRKGTERARERLAEIERTLAGVGLDEALRELLDVEDLASHWAGLPLHEKIMYVDKLVSKVEIQQRPRGAKKMRDEDVLIWLKGSDVPYVF